MIADRAQEAFTKHFNAKAPFVATAPGRINLIGEHTDYNDGFVFPMAIDRGVAVAARPTNGPTRLFSVQEGEGESFDVQHLDVGSVKGWAAYAAGVAWAMQQKGLGTVPNIEAAVYGNLPRGMGLSSSAALEVAFASMWNRLAGFDLDRIELAKISQKAENDFVGMQCGIMDQLASVCGKAGQALFVDTRSLQVRYAVLPTHLRAYICDTGKARALVDSEYNNRRRECEEAAEVLGVRSLRDAELDVLLNKQDELRPELVKRARHVITENTRCQGFFWALEDLNELRIGLLMRASHESLRDDYEVSCTELDAMAEACWSAPGCAGARMTGAGFGGSCVALVEIGQIEAFKRSVGNRYESLTGLQAKFLPCEPADGATVFATS